MISPGYFGLFNAQRGLLAAQTALNTLNHNIANANTPGYSRQRVELVTAPPYTPPTSVGQDQRGNELGQGVLVDRITRLRDTLLDGQYRLVNSQNGLDSQVHDTLALVESVLSEPSGNGIAAGIQKFFDATQELSLHPDSLPVRTAFLQQANDLVNVFQQDAQKLQNMQTDLVGNSATSELGVTVKDINDKLSLIASVNQQILTVSAAGGQPNDLMDTRDKLLDDLSKEVNITTTPGANNMVDISIAGNIMVKSTTLRDTLSLANNPGPAPNSGYVPTLVKTTTGGVVLNDGVGTDITGGKIKGILDAAGNTGSTTSVYGVLSKLNNLLQSITTEVNNLQLSGRDLSGAIATQPIFTPNPPAAAPPLAIFQYAVNSAVLADPSLVAAAADDPTASGPPAGFAGVGDGRNALAMAQLRNTVVTTPATAPLNTNFEDYFNQTISQLGIDTRSFDARATNGDNALGQLDLRRQSVSGVNLDEELTDLVRYQRSFESSSKMIQVFSEMLQTIINAV